MAFDNNYRDLIQAAHITPTFAQRYSAPPVPLRFEQVPVARQLVGGTADADLALSEHFHAAHEALPADRRRIPI
jgi:hypothetical protein